MGSSSSKHYIAGDHHNPIETQNPSSDDHQVSPFASSSSFAAAASPYYLTQQANPIWPPINPSPSFATPPSASYNSRNYFFHPPPLTNGWASHQPGPAFIRPPPPPVGVSSSSVGSPPPYVDHSHAKKIKNDVNVQKDSIRLVVDEQNSDCRLVSFTFDALVDGSITIFYFAKEGANCTFTPMYPEIYMPKRIPFKKGLGQKFSQPSGTGIDLGFFELDQLLKPSPEEDIFPLVISAEGNLPSFNVSEELDQDPATTSPRAQITQAVLEMNNQGHLQVKVAKQILWIDGVRYELREIYGIRNSSELGGDNSDIGKECVICITEPRDTTILPCRHMCLCSECAKELRLQSKNCPICRQPIEELLEIKIDNDHPPAH